MANGRQEGSPPSDGLRDRGNGRLRWTVQARRTAHRPPASNITAYLSGRVKSQSIKEEMVKTLGSLGGYFKS